MPRRTAQRGLSLIELMVTVVVIAILAAVALPNMRDFFDRKRLVSQTEAIANLIQLVRSEAIKAPSSGATAQYSATMKPGNPATWFVGLSNLTTGCDNSGTPCTLTQGGTPVTRVVTATECTGCTMTIVDGSGTQITTPVTAVFDLRGLVTGGTDYLFTLQSPLNKQLSVSISSLGRTTICSPGGSVSGYPTC